MKKIFVLAVIVAFLAFVTVACAEDLGVQIIGGEQNTNKEEVALSLDDLQMHAIYTVDNDAIVVPQEFLTVDFFAQFKKDVGDSLYTRSGKYAGRNESNSSYVYATSNRNTEEHHWRYASAKWQESGSGTQFAWFRTDITNTNESIANMTSNISVKCVYRDEYEFGGWIRMIDYSSILMDYSDGSVSRNGYELAMHPAQIVLHPDNSQPVGFMETGNYVFGCTLPNYVVEDKESALRMEVSIGETVLTYHIRK